MVRAQDDASVHPVTDAESSDFAPSVSPTPGKNKKRGTVPRVRTGGTAGKRRAVEPNEEDMEDMGMELSRLHGEEYHDVGDVVERQGELLDWFEGVREKRGMPWRKRYDDGLSDEEKGQRAYEVSLWRESSGGADEDRFGVSTVLLKV